MSKIKTISKKGLSPLLAIIIGLIVTIVAGILLAQLYFSYAATISSRPSVNIEYVDLVGTTLYMNIKNTGNVPIKSGQQGLLVDVVIDVDGNQQDDCDETITGSGEPGETFGIYCDLGASVTPGSTYSGSVKITFQDDSTQLYGFVVRARSS